MSGVIEVTDDSFQAEVLESDLTVLVFFSATWSGPCKQIAPSLGSVASNYQGKLKVVELDIDVSPSTARKFGVLSVPRTIIFKGGTLGGQLVGVPSSSTFRSFVERNL